MNKFNLDNIKIGTNNYIFSQDDNVNEMIKNINIVLKGNGKFVTLVANHRKKIYQELSDFDIFTNEYILLDEINKYNEHIILFIDNFNFHLLSKNKEFIESTILKSNITLFFITDFPNFDEIFIPYYDTIFVYNYLKEDMKKIIYHKYIKPCIFDDFYFFNETLINITKNKNNCLVYHRMNIYYYSPNTTIYNYFNKLFVDIQKTYSQYRIENLALPGFAFA